MHLLNETRMGIFGGTLLSIAALIRAEEVCRTLIFATIGAAMSFLVSYLLKRLTGGRKRNH